MLSIGQERPDKLRKGDRLAALLWSLSAQIFSLLGPRVTFRFFKALGGRLMRRSSNIGLISHNVGLAYKDDTAQRREEIVEGVVSALPLAIAELMLQPYWRRCSEGLTRHNLTADWLQPYVSNEKQAIYLLGHFSGWEANIMTLSRHLTNTVAVYAPPKNPLLEKYFREGRTDLSGKWTLWPRDMRGLQGRLAEEFSRGKSLIYALDAPLPGPMLPFMGLNSPTTLRPYKLAAETGAPIIPLNCGRDRHGLGFWIEAVQPIHAKGSSSDDVIELATTMNGIYSDWIRANPDHWYWTGQFFKPNRIWEARQESGLNS